MGRSSYYGVAPQLATTKPRTCLSTGCGKTFESLGPWQRICPECSGSKARVTSKLPAGKLNNRTIRKSISPS